MTGRALKRLVAQIPDDAKVKIAGPDGGGYDWVWCSGASVKFDEEEKSWVVEGVPNAKEA